MGAARVSFPDSRPQRRVPIQSAHSAPGPLSWWTPRVWSQRRASHLASPRLDRPPPQLPRDGRQADQVCGGAAGPGLPGLQARVPRACHLGQVRPHVLPRLHRGADSGGRHVPAGRARMRLGPTGPQPGRHRTDRRPRSACVRVYVCVRARMCDVVCIYSYVFTFACASVRAYACVLTAILPPPLHLQYTYLHSHLHPFTPSLHLHSLTPPLPHTSTPPSLRSTVAMVFFHSKVV